MLNHQLTARSLRYGRATLPSSQRGVVLMISLMILVALTLAGLALVRSVDTTNVIAGNLAFQQAATLSAEMGSQAAIDTVLIPFTNTQLIVDKDTLGYCASTAASSARCPPVGTAGNPADWDTYWARASGSRADVALATDVVGNNTFYVIQRLCDGLGEQDVAGCIAGPPLAKSINLVDPEEELPPPLYYRITTRVLGPRNTVSYVQTIVAK